MIDFEDLKKMLQELLDQGIPKKILCENKLQEATSFQGAKLMSKRVGSLLEDYVLKHALSQNEPNGSLEIRAETIETENGIVEELYHGDTYIGTASLSSAVITALEDEMRNNNCAKCVDGNPLERCALSAILDLEM